jgi:hypothetical protein
MHKSDFQYSVYTFPHTFNNPEYGILCAIAQNRIYRFKQIWAYIDANDFGTSGVLHGFLKFWQGGLLPPFTPGIQLNNFFNEKVTQSGLLMASMPIAFVASTSNTNTLNFGAHDANAYQERMNCYTYRVSRGTSFNTVPLTLNVEIVCDLMTLEIDWTTNQYNPAPSILASIGSTHPATMYPYYNFSPV